MAGGISGDYKGSCVVCLRGTDTALPLEGEAEWIVAVLNRLGLPMDQAYETLRLAVGSDPGKVPDGVVQVAVQVCADCVAKAKMRPRS